MPCVRVLTDPSCFLYVCYSFSCFLVTRIQRFLVPLRTAPTLVLMNYYLEFVFISFLRRLSAIYASLAPSPRPFPPCQSKSLKTIYSSLPRPSPSRRLQPQMELVRSDEFAATMSTALSPATTTAADAAVPADALSYSSLGFLILYDVKQAPAAEASGGLGDEFHNVLGPDQWWSWWAWLLFGLALLFCVCPLAVCIYCFRPGHSGPPSPTGSGGPPVMFGKGGQDGKGGDVEAMGGDLNAKQFEKDGGVYGEGDSGGYNDAATGISVSIWWGCCLELSWCWVGSRWSWVIEWDAMRL